MTIKTTILAAALAATATMASAGSYAPGTSDPVVTPPAKRFCAGENFISAIFGFSCKMPFHHTDGQMIVPVREAPTVGDVPSTDTQPPAAPAPVEEEDEPCYLSGSDDCEPDSESQPDAYGDWLEAR